MKTQVSDLFLKTCIASGIFTMLLPGNASAQNRIAGKELISSLSLPTASISPKFPQPLANGCDTVNYSKGFKAPKKWKAINWIVSSPNSGIVNGTNSFGDKEKGNYMDMSSYSGATHITGVFFWFKKAYAVNPAKTISINVYDNTGASGGPGALLASQTLTMASVMSDDASNYLTRVVFPSPIQIPASKKVFITCDYSSLTWTNAAGTDSLNIVASDTLEENPGLVWERTSANNWHPIDDNTTWNLKKSALYILPFVTNNITVPTASLTVTPANAVLCPGTNITFDPTGSVAPYSNGFWASPGYTSANLSGASLVLTYSVANTYTVGYQTTGCGVYSEATVVVTVNPAPTLTATCNSPVCAGASIQFNAASNAGTFSWLGPNAFTSALQNPVISPATASNTGSYAVTVTSAQSCVTTQIVNVLVNPCTGIDPVTAQEGLSIVQDETGGYFLLLDDLMQTTEVTILNICGSKISSAVFSGLQRQELNSRSLSAGMYFVQVNSGVKTMTGKIIVTR